MSECNVTQVYVNSKVVAKACKKIIDHILKQRAEIKEATIKELREPYRHWIFWKKQRTREEAEARLHSLLLSWDSNYLWDRHIFFQEPFLKVAKDLLKVTIINEGDIMLLSLDDAVFIEIWRDK